MAKFEPEVRKCVTVGCENFCVEPNIYCPKCAGYRPNKAQKEAIKKRLEAVEAGRD